MTAAAAGAIALVIGLLLSWKNELPRVRLVLLLGGVTLITGGMVHRVTGKAAHSINDVSLSASKTLFGTGVGILGLILLVWLLIRAFLKGGVTRWTDAAAVLTPPLAASAGGLVWALCLLTATVVSDVIVGGWHLTSQLGTSFIHSARS